MSSELNHLLKHKLVGDLDFAIGEFVGRLHSRNQGAPEDLDWVQVAASLASEQLQRGHVCLDLDQAGAVIAARATEVQSETTGEERISTGHWPEPEQWASRLAESPAVIQADPAHSGENLDWPLVIDQSSRRLYLSRYWFYQQRLGALIRQRLNQTPLAIDPAKAKSEVERLFPDRTKPDNRDQCIGAVNAVDQYFAVISGGPGTGKTTTVAQLLTLRLALHAGDDDLRILLMAPTGKAAQRLNESLGNAIKNPRLTFDQTTRERLSGLQAGTIHRLLGWTPKPPERGGPFRHTADDPLEADVVIVDEASMVDLALMYRLVSAVGPDAQLILMGDRDQLVSVEAGGVLSDLCGMASGTSSAAMTPDRASVIAERTGLEIESNSQDQQSLSNSVVHLTYSHRFNTKSTLGRLAGCIRAGDEKEAVSLLSGADPQEISWIKPDSAKQAVGEIVGIAEAGFADYLDLLKKDPEGSLQTLAALSHFRVLCALRRGALGVNAINYAVAQRLSEKDTIHSDPQGYRGQPVMVTRNDYSLGLFNGDVGLVTAGTSDKPARHSVIFEDPSAEGGVRRVAPALIPGMQTCYAMTIHKSQGSEFHGVVVVLPEQASPLLTRELLYTGITRVADKQDGLGNRKPGRLWVVGAESIVREAVKQRVRRTSGLRDAIVQLQGAT